MKRFCIRFVLLHFVTFGWTALATAQNGEAITGKPTNLDVHGDMQMDEMSDPPAGVDRASMSLGMHPLARVPLPSAASHPMTPILTRSYDNLRSGANLNETVLTPANARGLRKRFSLPITDDARGCEAQPLIVPQVTVEDGSTRDLCLICSMGNSVWAFDANTGALLWVQHLGHPIPSSRAIDGWLINDHWGIISTPVVDPDTKTLYCVTWSDPAGNWTNAVHMLHALNLKNGAHSQNPLNFSHVTYDPGHGLPVQSFSGSERKQRASLLLATIGGRKTVFVAFGTIKETSPSSRGWIVAVDVERNAVAAALTTTARFSGAGIWMAGQGPAMDTDGNLYVLTGNGSFDGVTEFGECFLKIQYTPNGGQGGSLRVIDWFSPFSDSGRAGGPQTGTHITVDKGGGWDDMDLGSGGVVVIPSKNLVGGCGKDGIWYSLNINNFGKTLPGDFANPAVNYAKAKWIGWFTFYNPASPTPTNFLQLNNYYANRTHHAHSTPVVFESANHGTMLFCGGENGNVRAWTANADGSLQYLACSSEVASPQSPVSANQFGGMPGFMLSLSASGNTNAILWATCPLKDANRGLTQGVVYAFDAENLGKFGDGSGALQLLWTSAPYWYNKFDPPVVSGGKVFVPTYDGKVDVYGL